MRRFEFASPRNVNECLQILAGRGAGAKMVAGGTDLLPQMKNGVLKPACVVDVSGLAELKVLTGDAKQGLRVGAAVTARQLELDPRVRAGYPALSESGALVGSVQVRNLATLGGNLCNAAPSADMAPPLVALDAEAVIAGPKGTRREPFASFFQGCGKRCWGRTRSSSRSSVPPNRPRSGGNYIRRTRRGARTRASRSSASPRSSP